MDNLLNEKDTKLNHENNNEIGIIESKINEKIENQEIEKLNNEIINDNLINENNKEKNEKNIENKNEEINKNEKKEEQNIKTENIINSFNKTLQNFENEKENEELEKILAEYTKNINEKEKKNKEKEIKKTEIPIIKNPLDFIEYFELREGINSINIKSSYKLQNRILNSKLNLKLIIKEPQTKLSNLIYKELSDNEITTLLAKKNNIGIGDIYGNVIFYSYKKDKNENEIYEKKKFESPFLKSKINFPQVTCMDLKLECDFLFIGYMNGSISMFEFSTGNLKFLNDKIHFSQNEKQNPIIDIKIYNFDNQKQTYEIISSDSLGELKISVIQKSIFSYRLIITQNLLNRSNCPIFFIKTIDFQNEKYSNFKNLGKYAIFGDLKIIRIFRMEPKTELVCYMIKPQYLLDAMIPDSSIGIGKSIEKYNTYSNNIENDNILLMAINWGTVIYIYELIIKNNVICYGNLLGHYVNNFIIQRLGFLSNSIIYLYDKGNNLKILNTRKFHFGELKISKDFQEPEINNNNNLVELENTIINIKGQNYLKSEKGHSRETFIYSIIENENKLHILGNNIITNVSLAKWYSCLNDLEKNNNWEDLLSISVQIYKGNFTALSEIPIDINERKEIIGRNLKQLITQFVILKIKELNISNNDLLNNDNYDEDKINECINITIEFCIEIESFDFLFQQIFNIFKGKNLDQLFLENLESYILTDRIINFNINEELILKIIDLYNERNRLNLLSQLLLHININNLDTKKIKDKLEELNLISPLIYLYMNGKEKNYFIPIEKLYDLYLKSKPIENFISYYLLKDISINEIFSSKQYIGHKLLWYIKLCISGRKFPNLEIKIEEEKFNQLIPEIIFWMINENNLKELCKFDPKDFFLILKNIFLIPKFFNILEKHSQENNDLNQIDTAILSNKVSTIKNIKPESIIQYIITMINNMNDKEILLYLYEFIIKISKTIEISKENIINFSSFILSNYSKLIKNINYIEINQLCIDFKNLFEKYELNENEYEKILNNCNDNIFDEIKLFILLKLKNESEILKVYINEKCTIENKEERLFKWLNLILTEFSNKKDKDKLKQIKELIFKNIDSIIQISYLKFKSLVNNWFSNEKNEILNKITEPKIKLSYIELLLKDIKKLLNNEIQEEDQLFIENTLRTHIELLCKLKEYDKILPSLKYLGVYPYDEIIDTLEKNNALDSLIYCLLKTGDPKRALNYCINNLNKYFDIIKNVLENNEFNENLYEYNFSKFEYNIQKLYYICKNNEQAIEELWKQFLMELYSINAKLNKITNNKTKQYNNFNQYLSNTIIDLIDSMCNYVSIIEIIEIVSENYKNAEFKEFKAILLKILDSNGNQETILLNAKKLLINNILYRQELFMKLNTHGSKIILNKCDFCNKNFDKNINAKEKIIFFKCGHLLHDKCVFKINSDEGEIVICSICRKNEIESSINYEGLSSNKIDNSNFKNENENENDDEDNYNYQELRLYSQMKNMDKRHQEKIKIYLEQ